jgi:choline dehydrogenase
MVSGIGPAATLKKYNISVVSDLPGVGQNMHDSCNIGGVSYPINLISPSTITTNATALTAATYEYLHNQTGVLTNPGGDFLNWEKLPAAYRANLSSNALADLSIFPSDWPEIEYVVNSDKGSLQGAATSASNSATIGSLLIAATSRGNVTIRSASMDDKPVISTNWLQTRADQEVAIQAYRRAREVWTYMANITTGPESLPGANYTTDTQILSYIQSKGISAIHHATSTNMMGRKNESMAVVDSHGKVFGVQNLRVIDSSSFRFTPPGHTQEATYAHAEKLVDDIKKGY